MSRSPRRAPSSASPARRRAFDVLMEAGAKGGFARDIMARSEADRCKDPRDEAFALRLALGVTACEGHLDDALDAHLNNPRKIPPVIRIALRVAAYEILYLDSAPEVAVSQGVELVRSCSPAFTGLANAVLHRVARDREPFLEARDAAFDQRSLVARARQSGLPVWLARSIEASRPNRSQDLLQAQPHPAPFALHVNPRRAEDLDAQLSSWGAVPLGLPGSWRIDSVRPILETDLLAKAALVVSDLNAQLVAAAATRPGSCLEIGAGRGTKTFMMACHAYRCGIEREHTALDLFDWKCKLNLERVIDAGLSPIEFAVGDARDLESALGGAPAPMFDTVFLDAPCSGTGTMRRHIEIPWRLEPLDVRRSLPDLQLSILKEASRRVSGNGELVYATCSVLAEENEGVIDAFLGSDEGRGFSLAPVSDAWIFSRDRYAGARDLVRGNEDGRGRFQTVPARDGFDGHFCARMVRA
ncbi:MAG: transcription antitermination factor NusB [Collinsella sp.]|nr:transcription antitermination factor NusB [Collinsella sp.]